MLTRSLVSSLFLLPMVTASAAEPVRFNRDIRPILSENCLFCHGPDANQRKADLRLDVEEVAKEHAIVAGDVSRSELIARIISTDDDERMPPPESGKQLTLGQIELLKRWVAEGAEYEGHWSFIAPERPQLPQVSDTAWPRSPLDHFILSRLDMEALEPALESDHATWLRRVTLDLTGLPPTVEEVKHFLNDQSDDAFEKVVDRLLQSKRYGEHMARYWLDAARYADTNGYQYDLEREQWVWRDWVIQAFNSNMPFDQFTVEQMAGDLLPDATDEQRLATAFHRNHPITIEGGVIDEEYRTEYVVDRVVTTSTVWMGLTMMCSRCHDHKYDPVSQREFYSFFAFFNNVPERGNNGFNPKLKVESPLQRAESEGLRLELASAERDLNSRLKTSSVQFNEWEAKLTDRVRHQWAVVVPGERRSQGGATLTVQPDQSILASGKNPATEAYELVFDCDVPVYAIRLEALTDPSFVSNSTGRGFNGNFVLSEFQIAITKGDSGEFQQVKIAKAEADYSQQNYNITLTIDGKIDRSGWAVDGNTKFENRVAVFTPDRPLLPDVIGKIRLQMHHRYGGSHHIGRFRIALAQHPVQVVPPDVTAIIAKDSAARSKAETARLNEYLAGQSDVPELRTTAARVQRLRDRVTASQAVPATMVMSEMPKPRTTRVLFRGEYDKPRDEVQPDTPAALPPLLEDAPRNRLGLAQWLFPADHPLTARVAVNRFWERLFGTGLVRTTEDFGSQGEWPSHPELLDWLAVDFVESGWDIRRMLKQIVLSATYRQSSRLTPETLARDPDNRLLARGPRMRLDAEVIRDSALFASGLLSDRLGGPSVFPYHPKGLWQEINNRPGYSRTYKQDSGEKLYRRSLYTFWKRTVPPPSMAAFDAPEREFCVVRRSRTNTPLQAFVMLHDPQFVEAARHLAERMLSEGGMTTQDRITFGFQLCYARKPEAAELSILNETVNQRLAQYRDDQDAASRLLSVGDSSPNSAYETVELAAWMSAARVLLNLSEFVTKP